MSCYVSVYHCPWYKYMMDWQNVIQQHPELDVLTVNYEDLKKVRYLLIRDRLFNLKGGWRLWFFVSFRNIFSDITRVRIFIFLSRKARKIFQSLTLGYMTNYNIFFSNIGNQNIFLEKKT